MKNSELILKLLKLGWDTEVMVVDVAPMSLDCVIETTITEEDADMSGDCEGKVGQPIILISR